MTLPELFPVFLIGILGSIHCVGMCGGFALTIAQASKHRNGFLTRQLSYYAGKTLTYVFLGILAGGMGATLGSLFRESQQVFSVAVGIILIVIGAGLVGWIRPVNLLGNVFRLRSYSRAIGRLMQKKSKIASFSVGIMNGFLPCGLVYAALALAAASESAYAGALQMGVFGLATIPALFLVASAGALMKPVWRNRLTHISGGVVMALGVITIVRVWPMTHMMH